jgi:PilZ domain
MEHRWGQRIRVDIPVRLETPPLQLGSARILNLSVSGAWISGELEQHTAAEIEVVFEPRAASSELPHRIPAFVARTRPDGIGVEWRELAPPLISALLNDASAVPALP